MEGLFGKRAGGDQWLLSALLWNLSLTRDQNAPVDLNSKA